jgi:hypothetical protein
VVRTVVVALALSAVQQAWPMDAQEERCTPVLAIERHGQVLLGTPAGEMAPVATGACVALDAQARRLAWCDARAAAPAAIQALHGAQLIDGRLVRRDEIYRAVADETIVEAAWSPDGSRLAFIVNDARFRSHVMLREPGAAVRRLASAPPAGIQQWWSLGWLGDGSAVTVHDMQRLGVIGLDGHAPEWVPLVDMIGERGQMLSSSDRVLASPSDPTVFAYTRMVPGTARFESVMHEPNTALFLHDRFLGRGKNLRLSAEDMTVLDVGWAPDGRSLYVSGYLDRHLRERDPFRVYRIGRDGRGLTELGRGERASVGCRPGPTGGAR